MKLESVAGIRQGFASLWESVAEGWQRLRESAAGALTRFRPGEHANVPAKGEVDDDFYLPSDGWSMLGGDVFEDERRLVVRLEVPGMDKDGFEIEVGDNFYKSNHAVTLPGETVTWRWTGSNQHNVTFDDPTIGNSATQTAGTFTRTFTPAPSGSSFTYYCTIHGRQAMSGIIEVR